MDAGAVGAGTGVVAEIDEIRRLTLENRARRDPAVEERLVGLRHRAWRSGTGAVESPPPVRAERVPAGPLPELEPGDLDVGALRRGFARHGCVLVRGLVGPERVELLRDGIDRALDAFDAGAAGAPAAETTPWYVPFTPTAGEYRLGGRRKWMRASGGMWTADSPRMLFELCELLDDTGVGAVVTDHLGERPALSANKCNLRRSPVDAGTDWHQDGAFLGESVRSVNLWLALSDCGVDAPGLDLLPRRLDGVLETGTEGALFDWSVSPATVDRLAEDTPVLRPTFRAGDALLFDHLFLHRTAVEATMTSERHAMETWMFAPSCYPAGQIPLAY